MKIGKRLVKLGIGLILGGLIGAAVSLIYGYVGVT